MALRKVTFRLYPNVTQSERRVDLLGLHQRLYNTALAGVNAPSQQNTLKRLDLAYQPFFRRVKAVKRQGFRVSSPYSVTRDRDITRMEMAGVFLPVKG